MPKELQDKYVQFTRDLIVWGSPSVIKKWEKFRLAGLIASEEILLFVDDVLQEIRKDLGNSNIGLKRGDLIKLFIKDPSELDRIMLKRKS